MKDQKSIKEHKEKGNYRPSRHANRAEEKVKTLKEIPEPPSYFDSKHRKKWAEVCGRVYDIDSLTDNDLDSLETYVKYWFIGKAAWEDIQKNGMTIEICKESKDGVVYVASVTRNPSILTMNEAATITERISDKFGGNPRSRMVIKTTPQDAKKVDPLDFLN